MDYSSKSYGRNEQVGILFKLFNTGKDVLMPGPRRLGKTFVLDRMLDACAKHNWHAIKAEVAGCSDRQAVYRALCEKISGHRGALQNGWMWAAQRWGQFVHPRQEQGSAWYQAFISQDYETQFQRLLRDLNQDNQQRWALLIDELPIFLKALHDKGDDGIAQARAFMNQLSKLRAENSNVRWLMTGSIGFEPLAREGNYMGVLAKFTHYELHPLSNEQAMDYVQDMATTGQLMHRQLVTRTEALELVSEVSWLSAYYLDALAQKLQGTPSDDLAQAKRSVGEAVAQLLTPNEASTFGTWEEHIHKHYAMPDKKLAFALLGSLAKHADGESLDSLQAATSQNNTPVNPASLKAILTRLDAEGFVSCSNWSDESPQFVFRNPLLRRWWQRFPPANGA
jgi:uncharacterized protein